MNHQELLKHGHHLLWLPNKDAKRADRSVLPLRAAPGAIAASAPAQTSSSLHVLKNNSEELSPETCTPG